MIEPTDKDIGRKVIYQPYWEQDRKGSGEEGVITSLSEGYVFVRYGRGSTSAATFRRDLEWVK